MELTIALSKNGAVSTDFKGPNETIELSVPYRFTVP